MRKRAWSERSGLLVTERQALQVVPSQIYRTPCRAVSAAMTEARETRPTGRP